MRESKFRGMNHETGKWVYGWYTKLVEGIRRFDAIISDIDGELVRFYIHDNKTIGEFTGLRDKSGKEIYEGDIVCGSVSLVNGYDFASDQEIIDDETFQSPITFNNGAFQAFINPWESLLSLDEAVANNIEFTVIGNIHESPELLEAK